MSKGKEVSVHDLYQIGQTYQQAAVGVRLALWYKQMGVAPRQLPIIPSLELKNITQTLEQAREGFRYTRQPSNHPAKQLRELSKVDSPKNLVSEIVGFLNHRDNLEVPAHAILAYIQFITTCRLLYTHRAINYNQLPKSVDNLSIGPLEDVFTYWNMPLHDDHQWSLLNEMNGLMNMVANNHERSSAQQLKIGHFMAVGAQLAEGAI